MCICSVPCTGLTIPFLTDLKQAQSRDPALLECALSSKSDVPVAVGITAKRPVCQRDAGG